MLFEITDLIRQLGFFLWTWVFGAALVVGGIYFTIRTRFVQFTTLPDAIRTIMGRDAKSNQAAAGSEKPRSALSAFQSFCISESSRVGTGNIVGTAVAITMGGPGAIFWMWAMALIGAATGFVESTMGQIYKENHGDRFLGGPMYYFQRAFKSKVPSYVVAIIIAITYGFVFNSIQTNTIADNLQHYVPGRIVIGIILAVIVAVIIFGGAMRIAKIATAILPFMVITFLVICFGIILFNLPRFFSTMGYIVVSAFGTEQIAGGAIGFTIGQAVQQGLRRGLFSNEAGLGTVPIAASTSVVSHPVKQGAVQSFGVFLDTLIICSATAFIVLMSGLHTTGIAGVVLVRESLTYFIGGFAAPFLNLMLFLLPFTSIIGNYFYGESCIRFASKKSSAITVYRILAIVLIVAASLAPLQLVWNLADIFTGTLVTFNVIVLFMIGKTAIACLDDYRKQRSAQKAGQGEEPVFYDDSIGIDTSCWKRNR